MGWFQVSSSDSANIIRQNIFKAVCLASMVLGYNYKTKAETKLAGSRPNIVIIMADDMSAQDFSCYGGTNPVDTPNIDKLASTGIQFRTAYAAAECVPSRGMLWSGQYAHRTGVWCNHMAGTFDYTNDISTFSVMQDAGYEICAVGKGHAYPSTVKHFDKWCIWPMLLSSVPGSEEVYQGERTNDVWPGSTTCYWQPFLVQNGKYLPTKPDDYGPDIFCDFVIDFIKENKDSDQPFLVYYSEFLPHANTACKNETPPTPDPDNPGKKIDGGVRQMKKYFDHQVGRVIKALEEIGQRDNTIVIITTDNGSGGPRGKSSGCEPAVWVPFIVNCPAKIPARGLVDEMVSFADFMPSFAELAGVELKGETDGMSFLPVLESKKGLREYLFSYNGGERIVRDHRWLLEKVYDDDPGALWDCGNITSGSGYDDPKLYYRDVTDSNDTEVLAAKKKLREILAKYPAPRGIPRTWAEREAQMRKMLKKDEIK
jgi:arylsulfatase A-like enzyme